MRGGPARGPQLQLGFTDPEVNRLNARWDQAAERELEAADPVLGDAATVQRFLTDAVQRFGGELRPTRTAGTFELSPGSLRDALAARGFDSYPLRLTVDRLTDPTALYVGRTHPLVATVCDAVLGQALAPRPPILGEIADGAVDGQAGGGGELFSRCGAVFTDAVRVRTGVLLVRLRYLLREQVDEFAEEIVLVAFERRDGQLHWLEPLETAGIDLLDRTRPVANMAPAERAEQARWALDFVQGQPGWWAPVVAARVAQLQAAHDRLRKLVRAAKLQVRPHTPPDILGCYVLVPGVGPHPPAPSPNPGRRGDRGSPSLGAGS